MFFDGDIRAGIAAATQESKAVVCLVRDDNEETLQWERAMMQEGNLAQALRAQAVVLRLEALSSDTQALSRFCVIDEAPTVVVIKNGMIRARLTGPPNEHGERALVAALESDGSSGDLQYPGDFYSRESAPAMPSQPTSSSSPDAADPIHAPAERHREASVDAEPAVDTPLDAAAGPSSTVERLLADRRGRLEAQRHAREASEKAEQAARQQANASSDPGREKTRQLAAAQQKRLQDARHERERILKLVENDRIERREREERRRALAKAQDAAKAQQAQQQQEAHEDGAGKGKERVSSSGNQPSPPLSSSATGECAIQIRLLDGSTVRTRLSAQQATLSHDVRSWIASEFNDQNGGAYTFRQILAPHPSRAFSDADEHESLASLGLAPTATLVLHPVGRSASAYGAARRHPGAGARRLVYLLPSWLLAAVDGLVMWIGVGFATVLASLRGRGGLGTTASPDTLANPDQRRRHANAGASASAATALTHPSATGSQPRTRIKTLRDRESPPEPAPDDLDPDHAAARRRARPAQQFYNGNQLNFEPNEDDGEESADDGH
ncbi:MAG: hypothetical protein M1826_001144 [Phylliscum demangeonii]|nr:MAG: hypothetical protein M1826_001144 [Phylliscum demangeonii]